MKTRHIAMIGAAAAAALYLCVNFETTEEHYAAKENEKNTVGSVYLSVDCKTFLNTDKAKSYIDKGVIPSDGEIIKKTAYNISEGDSAFTVLKTAVDKNRIIIDYDNVSGKSVYVKGISSVYEYDGGDLSGWMYSVNGEFPTVASSDYYLSDGDVVAWVYSCNLGKDVGDTF
ncbi:MAG: DUF4430 domain-containing protein [Clostridia bacterium]|nr:DUF4430 domain-containing protein [Clostridia bacterium]